MNTTKPPQIVSHTPLLSIYPVLPEDSFPLDLPDAIDALHAGAVVKVTPTYGRKAFFGNVVTVNVEECQVLVQRWDGATDWQDADVVELIWTAAAAAIAMELQAEMQTASL